MLTCVNRRPAESRRSAGVGMKRRPQESAMQELRDECVSVMVSEKNLCGVEPAVGRHQKGIFDSAVARKFGRAELAAAHSEIFL